MFYTSSIPTLTSPPISSPKPPTQTLHSLSKQPIFTLGAHLSILLQWSLPPLAHGTTQHSSFAKHPLLRLHRTSIFMTAAIYGSPSQLSTITSMITKQHAHVKGGGYDARDGELQKWVAATLFVALIRVYETFLGRMEWEEMEGVMRGCGVFAESLGMEGSMWPRDLGEFWGYWEKWIEGARVGDEARRLKELLTWNNGRFPWWVRLGLPVLMMLTARWLPEKLRVGYGLPDPDGRWRRVFYWFVVLVVRWGYWVIPGWVEERWHRGNVRDMEEAVDEIRRSGRWPV